MVGVKLYVLDTEESILGQSGKQRMEINSKLMVHNHKTKVAEKCDTKLHS